MSKQTRQANILPRSTIIKTMEAADFPEANGCHGAPAGMSESNVKTLPSFKAKIEGGQFDDADMVVVAWRPSAEDLDRLSQGGLIYLSCIGGLPPHFLCTTFPEAVRI